MAIIEDLVGGEALAGAGLGAGILVLVPRLLRGVARPAAKALIRGGIVLYRGAAELIEEAATDPRVSLAAQRSQSSQRHAERGAAHEATAGGETRSTARKAPPRRRKKSE